MFLNPDLLFMAASSSNMSPILEDDPEMLEEPLDPAPQNNNELMNRTLVGKMRSVKSLNTKAVKEVIANAWANYPGLQITEVDKNLFMFHFANEHHKEMVLKRAPWFILNHLLCLESWNPMISYQLTEFTTSPMWIQVHNLPLELISASNARKILKRVGEVLEIEDPVVDGRLLRTFVRGRVKVELEKPLPTGCWVPRSNLPNLWVKYRYERIQSLCFKCGILGHDQNYCSKPTVMSQFYPDKPKYAPELTVNAPRSIHYLGNSSTSTESPASHTVHPETTQSSPNNPENTYTYVMAQHRENQENLEYYLHDTSMIRDSTPPLNRHCTQNTPTQTPNTNTVINSSAPPNPQPIHPQATPATPTFTGKLKTITLPSPNQRGGKFNPYLDTVQLARLHSLPHPRPKCTRDSFNNQ